VEATPTPPPAVAPLAVAAEAGLGDAGVDDAGADAEPVPFELHPLEKEAIDGPHEELSIDAGRPVWYALPKRGGTEAARLIGHIHGVCGGPAYACGKWIGAGTAAGVMVCPTGNAHCGESPLSPPSWEAPTWMELVGIIDRDLETSIAKVASKRKGAFTREGAILTGYSRGAYAAPQIARSHPNRWRHMVLIEANVPLSLAGLKAAGVRSVAFVAGEHGDQIQGMRKTEASLGAEGYPIKLFVMRKTGHPYSTDMEDVMASALGFVLQHDE
jgi:predicted esterase